MPIFTRPTIGNPLVGSTAGSVIFAGTNGVFQQDNANLFWDDSNNRLGIGDASPDAKLDIDGSGNITPLGVTATLNPSGGGSFYGSDINLINANTATANTVYAQYSLLTDNTTVAGNNLYAERHEVVLTGNASKFAYGISGSITSSSTSGDLLYSGHFVQDVTGGISTGARNQYGMYAKIENNATNTGGTVNMYGIYGWAKHQAPGNSTGSTVNVYGGYFISDGLLNTGGTITNYGLFVANGGTNTTGITTKYGLNIAAQTGSDSNYGARIDAATQNTLWLSGNADNTTESAGIVFGLSKDTNLYRSAANTLKTDDSFIVGNDLTVTDDLTVSGGTITLDVDTDIVLSGGINGLSIDSTTFSIDSTNHRVGIGTAAPANLIDVRQSNSDTTMGNFSKTGAFTAGGFCFVFQNNITSSTASIVKYGGYFVNSGTWNGANALSIALLVSSTGGTNNFQIYDNDLGAKLTGGTWTNAPSWRRLKKDITTISSDDINDCYDWLLTYDPVTFRYKDTLRERPDTKEKYTVKDDSPFPHTGFILDDMPEKMREFIMATDDGGISTKDMEGVILMLLQKAAKKIKELENRLDLLGG